MILHDFTNVLYSMYTVYQERGVKTFFFFLLFAGEILRIATQS